MIVLQLSGGLGNQMFQIAMAWRLEQEGKSVTIDDTTAYRQMGEGARNLQLFSAFGITYPKAERADLVRLRDESPKLSDKIRRKLFGRNLKEVRDEDFVFDKRLLALDEVYLTGTFQCPAYFAPIAPIVRMRTKSGRQNAPAAFTFALAITSRRQLSTAGSARTPTTTLPSGAFCLSIRTQSFLCSPTMRTGQTPGFRRRGKDLER